MNDTITLPRSVVEQALSDLSSCSSVTHWPALVASIDALREALKQQVEQELVSEITGMDEYDPILGWHKPWVEFPVGTKLYIRPQPPAEQHADTLTHEDIVRMAKEAGWGNLVSMPHISALERFATLVAARQPPAVEQPEGEQKPIAEVTAIDEYGPCFGWRKHWAEVVEVGMKIYTRPQPKRELTDGDIRALVVPGDYLTVAGLTTFARSVERKIRGEE